MNHPSLTITLLLSCLPLLSGSLWATDMMTTKPVMEKAAMTDKAAMPSTMPMPTKPMLPAKPAMPSEPVAAARKINLNTATIEELSSLNGIGEKKAQAIIDYREKQGNFTSIEQLVDVSGVGPAILEKNKALISVQ